MWTGFGRCRVGEVSLRSTHHQAQIGRGTVRPVRPLPIGTWLLTVSDPGLVADFYAALVSGNSVRADKQRQVWLAILTHEHLSNSREESMVTHVDVDIQQLWCDFKASPTVELRNQLVEHYMPLVRYNAERIWSRLPEGVDLDDLISAGVFGLMDAIDAFDLDRGVKFETYCVPRIRGAMLDELRTMDWVPRLVRSKHTKLEESRKILETELGRPPRPDEMAERLGVSVEEYEKMEGDATAVGLVSLNKKWYETDSYKDVREIDILEDKKAEDPTHRLQNRDLMRLVTRGLNRNERLIIILYYYEDMTMKEIGATLDLSESRVSQMHSSIVARLQAQLAKRRPEFST
jgi:RNA polymerase sigma factor for flagellar operon FliA